MVDLADRAQAHDRVAHNRRATRRLLLLLGVMLVPLFSAITVWVYGWSRLSLPAIAGADSTDLFSAEALGRSFVDMTMLSLVVVLIGVALTLFAVWRIGARRMLHSLHVQPWDVARYPAVGRSLENLSLGRGVARPELCLIDSAVPNALVAGTTPADTSLALSRGLIELLDRRELDGVLAHELSHIANEDPRLDTVVAALMAIVGWPALAARALVRLLRSPNTMVRYGSRALAVTLGLACITVGPLALTMVVLSLQGGLFLLAHDAVTAAATGDVLPRWLVIVSTVWYLHALLAPFYIVLGAPFIAYWVRRAVARQREFLADADAVTLTRDPEGLALALAKIGAAAGELASAESIAHAFIVAPRPATGWLDRRFPTHPSIEQRIEMLARMGSGLAPAEAIRAVAAGRTHRDRARRELDARRLGPPPLLPRAEAPGAIPIYEQPDGWSRVVEHAATGASFPCTGRERGNFREVRLGDGRTGWMARVASPAGPATASSTPTARDEAFP